MPYPDVLSILEATFPTDTPSIDTHPPTRTYAPTLRPLHSHFCRALYSTLAPFTSDPSELAYVASARWPGFVQPVLEEAARQQEAAAAENEEEVDGEVDFELVPPSEETRIRLVRHFTPSFTAALEALYPRHTHAAAWAEAHPFGTSEDSAPLSNVDSVGMLPRLTKYVLVAAYLASTNPARSDVRMFGRLDDGSRRRKRKGGGTRKPRGGGNAGKVKVCYCSIHHCS